MADIGGGTDEDGHWALCSGELLPAPWGAGNQQTTAGWEKRGRGGGGRWEEKWVEQRKAKQEERTKGISWVHLLLLVFSLLKLGMGTGRECMKAKHLLPPPACVCACVCVLCLNVCMYVGTHCAVLMHECICMEARC